MPNLEGLGEIPGGYEERKETFKDEERIIFEKIQVRFTERARARLESLRERKEKLEKSILNRVLQKKKLANIEKSIQDTGEIIEYMESPEFSEKLRKWEPWRLNQRSIDRGINLHINIAKEFSTDHFKQWVTSRARDKGIPEDEIWAGIIETIRKIQWETTKKLIARDLDTKIMIPPFTVFGSSPHSVNFELLTGLKGSRRTKDIGYLLDKKLLQKEVGFAYFVLLPYELQQIKARTMGGPFMMGTYGENIVAIEEDEVVRESIDSLFSSSIPREEMKLLISVVAEETIHFQGYKEKELRELINIEEKAAQKPSFEERLRRKKELEESLNIHNFVPEITEELSQQKESLAQPLLERISKRMVT